ncbi:MAG: helix-turn-helix transcriptional regulator [Pseudobdellovibrionaceae bacterium]
MANDIDKSKEVSDALKRAAELLESYRKYSSTIPDQLISADKVGAVIKTERKKQKITRDTLARLSGVSVGTIIAIESGKTTASLSNVQKILQTLGKRLCIT